jgi:hypothetical protein
MSKNKYQKIGGPSHSDLGQPKIIALRNVTQEPELDQWQIFVIATM